MIIWLQSKTGMNALNVPKYGKEVESGKGFRTMPSMDFPL